LLKEYCEEEPDDSFINYVFFDQSNNDGRLFLNCVLREEDGKKVCEIHYCFTDIDYNILDAEQYMEWESESMYDHWRKLLPEDVIATCNQNMAFIKENAILMSSEELESMIRFPYENIPKPF